MLSNGRATVSFFLSVTVARGSDRKPGEQQYSEFDDDEITQACLRSLQNLYKKYRKQRDKAAQGTSNAADLQQQRRDHPDDAKLPLDPYFIGLYMGDGIVNSTSIAGSEETIETWLRGYADRLTRAGPAPVHLKTLRKKKAGSKIGKYTRNKDTFTYTLSAPPNGGYANPVRVGLRKPKIFTDKWRGLPFVMKDASPTAKLKCLAGLIDSDGSYSPRTNRLEFSQHTPEHSRIVLATAHPGYDRLEAASSSSGAKSAGADGQRWVQAPYGVLFARRSSAYAGQATGHCGKRKALSHIDGEQSRHFGHQVLLAGHLYPVRLYRAHATELLRGKRCPFRTRLRHLPAGRTEHSARYTKCLSECGSFSTGCADHAGPATD